MCTYMHIDAHETNLMKSCEVEVMITVPHKAMILDLVQLEHTEISSHRERVAKEPFILRVPA